MREGGRECGGGRERERKRQWEREIEGGREGERERQTERERENVCVYSKILYIFI